MKRSSIMKRLLSVLLTVIMLLTATTVPVMAEEETAMGETTYFKAFPKAEYETVSPDYSLKVNGQSVDTVAYFEYKDGVYRYSYAHLAYEGTASFEITNLRGAIEDYNLSPHSYGMEAAVSGNKLSFSLTQKDSRYIVLRTWVNGERYELFIACDPKLDYGLDELKKGNFYDAVKDLGFDNTGKTKLSAANGTNATGTLQNAIDKISSEGGGTLYFPAGTYSFVYLDAKDNVTIYLDEGAYLRGTGDRTDYTWNATGVNGRQGGKSPLVERLTLREIRDFEFLTMGLMLYLADGRRYSFSIPYVNEIAAEMQKHGWIGE